MIDPRLRQRVEVVAVRPSVRPTMTNLELLENFVRTSKLSKSALAGYKCSIRDFILYMRQADGREVPAREWTKDAVWAHLHFVEANYCAHFRAVPRVPGTVICRLKMWKGLKEAAEASQDHCLSCPSFKRPMITHRVNALSKFFKHLARVGAIPVNFMADVVSDYWEENPIRGDDEEKRRNPTVDEMLKLVNGTLRPQSRAFYATSAKWWFRPNEMFLVDRYASFGIAPPEAVRTPEGFEDGFPRHQHIESFDAGGDMVYLPKKPGRPDKRQGNRWSVIDAELRPILEQHFAWWERTVKRDAEGRPKTTSMWINERGDPLDQGVMYRNLFHDDCLRLGLVTKEELANPRRVWTAHCQRHFGEKLLEMHNVPDNWCNHFRGDKLKDARGHYFKPKPEEVRKKYHELVPIIGFQALPEMARWGASKANEIGVHRETLLDEIRRAHGQIRRLVHAASVKISWDDGSVIVPRRIVAAYLFALKVHKPGTEFRIEVDRNGTNGREFEKDALVTLCDEALAMIRASA